MRRTRQPPQLAHRSTYMWQHAGAATSDTAQPGHVNRFSASSSVLYCFVLCSTGVVLRRFSVTSHFNPATIDGGEGVGRFLPWSLRAKHPKWFWPVLPAGAAAPTFWQTCWSNASLIQYVIAWAEQELTKDP